MDHDDIEQFKEIGETQRTSHITQKRRDDARFESRAEKTFGFPTSRFLFSF